MWIQFDRQPNTYISRVGELSGNLPAPLLTTLDELEVELPQVIRLDEAAQLLGRMATPSGATIQSMLGVTPQDARLASPGSVRSGLYQGRITANGQHTGNVVFANPKDQSTLPVHGIVKPDRGVTFGPNESRDLYTNADSVANAAANGVYRARMRDGGSLSKKELAELQKKRDSARAQSTRTGVMKIDHLAPVIDKKYQELAALRTHFRKSPPVRYRPENAFALVIAADALIGQVVSISNQQRGLNPAQQAAVNRTQALMLYGAGKHTGDNWRTSLELARNFRGAQLGRLDELRHTFESIYAQHAHNISDPKNVTSMNNVIFRTIDPSAETDYDVAA